jgi:uncharacterized small protein (DUF1192 family)
MIREDDDLPKNRAIPLKDLTPLSVTELQDYIAGLDTEIARARAAIDAKKNHRSGVDALFKR